MKNLFFFLLTVLLAASCQSTDEIVTPAASGHILTRSQDRPFTATISSAVDVNSPLTACSGDLPGFAIPDHFLDGQALHLGNLDGAESTLHHDDCDLSFATLTLTTTVSGQLAAANGDLVYYAGDDVIDVANLLTGAGTTGPITGTWTITGGTGRFAGATGEIAINGQVDFTSGTFTASASGTINF